MQGHLCSTWRTETRGQAWKGEYLGPNSAPLGDQGQSLPSVSLSFPSVTVIECMLFLPLKTVARIEWNEGWERPTCKGRRRRDYTVTGPHWAALLGAWASSAPAMTYKTCFH